MVYDMNTKSVIRPDYNLKDISITRFKPLNDKELLIATDGGGVHKINMDTYQIVPEIVADYNSNCGMNGNSINDILWMMKNGYGWLIIPSESRYKTTVIRATNGLSTPSVTNSL